MKKVLALVLAALLAVTMFAACSNNETTEDTTVADGPFAGQTLVMGTSADFPPYEYIAEDGSYTGIDVDLATAICEKLGATLEIKDMDFNGIVAAVETKAIDFGMSGMTITPLRLESVNFSTPYETAKQVILVKKGSEIATPDDLEGKKIGVQSGTTGDDMVTKKFGADAVAQYQKYSLAIQALLEDMVDCVVLDEAPAKAFAAENEGLTVLDTEFGIEEYAICFNKENTDLLDAFNAALAELQAEGKVDEIFAKYDDEEDAGEETEEAAEETTEAAEEETGAAEEETETDAAEEETAA